MSASTSTTTTSPSRNTRKSKRMMKTESNIVDILSKLRSDIFNFIDEEDEDWLKAINKTLHGYNLGMQNVKQLLLEILLSDHWMK